MVLFMCFFLHMQMLLLIILLMHLLYLHFLFLVINQLNFLHMFLCTRVCNYELHLFLLPLLLLLVLFSLFIILLLSPSPLLSSTLRGIHFVLSLTRINNKFSHCTWRGIHLGASVTGCLPVCCFSGNCCSRDECSHAATLWRPTRPRKHCIPPTNSTKPRHWSLLLS